VEMAARVLLLLLVELLRYMLVAVALVVTQ
jgi:hypothetical protein